MTLDNRQVEFDQNDRMFNISHTMLLGNRATNELRFSHVGEDRVDANLAYAGLEPAQWNTSGWIKDMKFVGLNGRDQFDIGSQNSYADFATGLAAAHGGADSRNYTRAGLVYLRDRRRRPHAQDRLHVQPGDGGAAAARRQRQRHVHLPAQHSVQSRESHGAIRRSSRSRSGTSRSFSEDDWLNGFVQDQWRVTSQFTLNGGIRFDYQDLTPGTMVLAARSASPTT